MSNRINPTSQSVAAYNDPGCSSSSESVRREQIPPAIGEFPTPTLINSISRKQIYQEIESRICHVRSSKGTATGICVSNKGIIIPFHAVQIDCLPVGADAYQLIPRPIYCTYKGVRYEATLKSINLDWMSQFDCTMVRIDSEGFPNLSEIELFTDEAEVGEDVYFGGFPLTQEDPTLHSGIISSKSKRNGLSYFTIDGTVVPGNSGGPVFVVHENRIKLIGIISSLIVDFSREDQKTLTILKALKVFGEKNPVTNRGGNTLDWRGVTTEFNIQSDQGSERIQISTFDIIMRAYELIERNLSTGISRVLHAKHLLRVPEQRPPSDSSSSSEIPVIKGERLPGRLATDRPYFNWYHDHVKGQPKCGKILGYQLNPGDRISKEAELILRRYYISRDSFAGFEEPTLKEELEKLKLRIFCATPKALKTNPHLWEEKLDRLAEELDDPADQELIAELYQIVKNPTQSKGKNEEASTSADMS